MYRKNHSNENNIKIKYANEFVQKLDMGYPTACANQFIQDKNDRIDTKIMQYFIMHGLVLCIKVDSYVAHMFHAWSFSNNTTVPIAKKKKIFTFLEYKHYYICLGSW